MDQVTTATGAPADGKEGRTLFALVSAAFLMRSTYVVLPFLTSLMAASGGWSPESASLAFAAMGAGGLVGALAAGSFGDRFGLRRALFACLLGAACITPLLWVSTQTPAQSLLVVASTAFMLGLLLDGYRPLASAAVGHAVPSAGRQKAFGLVASAGIAGGIVGPLVAGWLSRESWSLLFVQQAVGVLVVVAILAWGLPRDTTPPKRRRGATGYGSTWRRAKFLLLCTLLFAMATSQMLSTFPLYLLRQGIDTAFYGVLLSINSAVALIVLLPIIALGKQVRAEPAIAACAAIVAVGTGCLWMSPSAFVLIFYSAAIGVASSLMFVVGPARASSLADPAHMGAMHSLYGTSVALGLVLGPSIGGWLLHSQGPNVLIAFSVACSIASGILILFQPNEIRAA